MAVAVALSTPLIGVSYFMKFSYSPYSLLDPRFNLTLSDLTEDFWSLPRKIVMLYPVGVAFTILALIYIGVNFLQEVILFYYSVFPEFRLFNEETK